MKIQGLLKRMNFSFQLYKTLYLNGLLPYFFKGSLFKVHLTQHL
jgi:hypothetical protein